MILFEKYVVVSAGTYKNLYFLQKSYIIIMKFCNFYFQCSFMDNTLNGHCLIKGQIYFVRFRVQRYIKTPNNYNLWNVVFPQYHTPLQKLKNIPLCLKSRTVTYYVIKFISKMILKITSVMIILYQTNLQTTIILIQKYRLELLGMLGKKSKRT